MMRLYHSSNVEVSRPDTRHSRRALDFGAGFYLTRLREQAERYALRFLKRGERAFLNVYEIDEELGSFTSKVFIAYDAEWLDYITLCRKEQPHVSYDFIEGGVADDQVFNTVDLYVRGFYTKEQALNELAYKRPNHQICITSQRLLDERLRFVQSVELFL